jgi:hypothetical protein
MSFDYADGQSFRNNCLRSRVFSKRDKVGCERQVFARDRVATYQQLVYRIGTSRAASLVSGYPQAIAITCCVSNSLNSCLTFSLAARLPELR